MNISALKIQLIISLLLLINYKGISQNITNGKYIITSIDSIEAYYYINATDTLNKEIIILSLKKDTLIINKNKIEIGETYNLDLEMLWSIFLDEEMTNKLMLPESEFYIKDKFISSMYKKPYEAKSLNGLYIEEN